MTEILPPNRQQLAEFIANHETIRRFEILFRMVGEDLPDAITNNSEGALSAANNALALINDIVQQLANDLSAIEAKVTANMDTGARHDREIEKLRFYCHAVNTI